MALSAYNRAGILGKRFCAGEIRTDRNQYQGDEHDP